MQITDPLISETGELYSLAGIKKLFTAVTKHGNVEESPTVPERKINQMNKFETSVAPELDRIRRSLEQGASVGEIAEGLGISVSTLYRYREQYPELRKIFDEAKNAADDMVESALLRRATGYENSDGKEIAPDVRAAVFWLKNRRPQSWRDRRELAVEPMPVPELKDEEKNL